MFFTKVCTVLQTKPNKAKQSQTKPTENMIQIMTLDWMCYASKKSKITRRISMKTLLGSVLLQESTEWEVCYMVQMRWIWGVTQTEI